MKLDRLLLCAVSAWSIGATPVLSLPPSPLIAQSRSEEQTNIDVYQKASPAVVTLLVGRGSGSGSLITPEGLILTNEHVIRAARGGQVRVKTAQGRTYTGEVIAVDRSNDLALVQLATQDRFPTIPLAHANSIQVGQRVYAIGSPYGLSGTLTTGILSRVDPRTGDLQTDASLNPGNSGGPLLNSRGELIGVNKAIISADGRSNSGIGFATSATVARDLITRSANRSSSSGNVVRSSPSTTNGGVARTNPSSPNSARLGVSVDQNLMIVNVEPGSLASEIGFQPGDQLIAINRRRLRGVEDLISFMESRPRSAILTISRNRRLASVRVNF